MEQGFKINGTAIPRTLFVLEFANGHLDGGILVDGGTPSPAIRVFNSAEAAQAWLEANPIDRGSDAYDALAETIHVAEVEIITISVPQSVARGD